MLTHLTKKDKEWHWGEEEAKQFQELKDQFGNTRVLGTHNSEGEFVVLTDASLVGGGDTLFQWQKLPELGVYIFADELQKTLRINRDVTLKHKNEPRRWHLVPIGYWNTKWSSTRANYSTYERELLPGILLLSGQRRLLGTNLMVGLFDQECREYFLKGDAPENQKLRRLRTYFAQLRLKICRAPGLKLFNTEFR